MKPYAILWRAALLAVALVAPTTVHAQAYPDRPIKLVVPFGPGSGSDLLARVLSARLGEQMKQPVVVENREGAGGLIGASLVAKSPADGYTIVLVSNAITIAPQLQPSPPFDLIKDFVPIAKIAIIPLVVITSGSSPFTTFQEMVVWLKANPAKANYASSGNGAQSHLEAAQLMHNLGVPVQHVPYKSTGQAMTDTVTGAVSFYIPALGSAMPNIKGGKLRAVAIGGNKRNVALPDVPTVNEATGSTIYEVAAWFGILAPAGTPPDIIGRLQVEIAKAMESPTVQEKLPTLSAEMLAVGSAQFGRELKAEYDKWGTLIRTLNIKGD
jgi:tripartite-type tricarboxylate transporter receptor subunit TctC